MMKGRVLAAMVVTCLAGCSVPADRPTTASGGERYPLASCVGRPGPRTETGCRVAFFREGADIGKRDSADFPRRYLELYDPAARTEYCEPRRLIEPGCEDRLKVVSDYFNPLGGRPGPDEIGVALEGGGTKTAPFALGVLAGLHDLGLLEDRVAAIASVSGGSYAASYFYNRWFDRLASDANVSDTGTYEEWFRSCIPSYFIENGYFGTDDSGLPAAVRAYECGEKVWKDGHLVNSTPRPYGEYFKPEYVRMGHVWTNHDLLRGDAPGDLTTDEDLRWHQWLDAVDQVVESAASTPFSLIARNLFRWPFSSAPTKLAYKLGLERQYGYSPRDWAAAGDTDLSHLASTLSSRCETRTLKRFAEMLNDQTPALRARGMRVPKWIAASSAPGSIGLNDWLTAPASDSLRMQYELTWDGHGSGVYGYAFEPPEDFLEVCGRRPDGMPMLDAVVASAAFADDDQLAVVGQPDRVAASATLHFLNIEWFTELRNFNVGEGERLGAVVMPWPLYLTQTVRWNKTPYVHLQDGGNTDNGALLPLLRRGYRTIVYSHSETDRTAQWKAICRLKNQFEMDRSYRIDSPRLEKLMSGPEFAVVAPNANGGWGQRYGSFLDGLCSSQLNASDLAAYDRNPDRSASDPPDPAVARVYCDRLHPERKDDPVPCPEFAARFDRSAQDFVPEAAKSMFYHWPASRVVTFQVRHYGETAEATPLSTIVAIVPAISFHDFVNQSSLAVAHRGVHDWREWCAIPSEERRKEFVISGCIGPIGTVLVGAATGLGRPALSCVAAAHIVEDECSVVGDPQSNAPAFPQDNFFFRTYHTSYLSYGAYFDMGRSQVANVLCAANDKEVPVPAACARSSGAIASRR
jgi:hypothetical protein